MASSRRGSTGERSVRLRPRNEGSSRSAAAETRTGSRGWSRCTRGSSTTWPPRILGRPGGGEGRLAGRVPAGLPDAAPLRAAQRPQDLDLPRSSSTSAATGSALVAAPPQGQALPLDELTAAESVLLAAQPCRRAGRAAGPARAEPEVQEALLRLSIDHRAILLLREVEKPDGAEIARALEWPKGRSRAGWRAREALRHALASRGRRAAP